MSKFRETATGGLEVFDSGVWVTVPKAAEEEIVALRNFLEIALDVHDDHFGPTDANSHPRNWDVQARKRLSEH
jgi:hypothetical protein